MSSTKRSHDEDAAHEAHDDRAKRSRRTRWGHDEEDASDAKRKTSASPKGAYVIECRRVLTLNCGLSAGVQEQMRC